LLNLIQACGRVRETCILSTCNRTELYAAGDQAADLAEVVTAGLTQLHGLPREDITPYLYQRHNSEASRHLLQVASGLDSLILGEGQILAQVREAHRRCSEQRSVGAVLGRLFERALHTGKRVRTETRIVQGAASIAAAAVELSRKVFGNLGPHKGLVLGTGKMGMLTARLLVTAGLGELSVMSRTHERSQQASAEFVGQTKTRATVMEQLDDELTAADIVVACTGSPTPVITRSRVAGLLRRRRYRPLFIVDIAVPRDVEGAVNELDNVYLYNVDDLAQVVDQNLAERQAEVDHAGQIVEHELREFTHYLSTLGTVPAIRSLRDYFEYAREREVAGLLATHSDLSEAERKRLEAFSRALVGRLLHEPTVRIKELGSTRNVTNGLSFVSEVFAPPAPGIQAPQAEPSGERGAPLREVGHPAALRQEAPHQGGSHQGAAHLQARYAEAPHPEATHQEEAIS
jgi:glutamyl-tRNA reductase